MPTTLYITMKQLYKNMLGSITAPFYVSWQIIISLKMSKDKGICSADVGITCCYAQIYSKYKVLNNCYNEEGGAEMRLAAVILAAGKGTRMKSALPKVLHPVGGKPMLGHVLEAVKRVGAERTVVVAGFWQGTISSYVGENATVVVQREQLGTAHALMQAAPELASFPGHILVLCGDTPLITEQTLSQLVKTHLEQQASATVLTTVMDDPTGYGRVIRDASGRVERIVEQKDGSPRGAGCTGDQYRFLLLCCGGFI